MTGNTQQAARGESGGEPPHSKGTFLLFVAARFLFRCQIRFHTELRQARTLELTVESRNVRRFKCVPALYCAEEIALNARERLVLCGRWRCIHPIYFSVQRRDVAGHVSEAH